MGIEQSTLDGVQGCVVISVNILCMYVFTLKNIACLICSDDDSVITSWYNMHYFSNSNRILPALDDVFHHVILPHLQTIGWGPGLHKRNPPRSCPLRWRECSWNIGWGPGEISCSTLASAVFFVLRLKHAFSSVTHAHQQKFIVEGSWRTDFIFGCTAALRRRGSHASEKRANRSSPRKSMKIQCPSRTLEFGLKELQTSTTKRSN